MRTLPSHFREQLVLGWHNGRSTTRVRRLKAANYLCEIGPGAGAYLNEPDFEGSSCNILRNFLESFWGGHHRRLVEIKKK
ncbi:hypothetical protein CPC08DRAFT_707595 [Agrocybe pediades]|nr:hypothetical protein CPC08DRAFT_707595 [Agrocybe pediades]